VYAADILDLYFDDNETDALEWLYQKSSLYQDQQALTLIDDLLPKQLLSTKCMQSHMSTRWYGDPFNHNKNFTWELLVKTIVSYIQW
jgi:hypothetical protein